MVIPDRPGIEQAGADAVTGVRPARFGDSPARIDAAVAAVRAHDEALVRKAHIRAEVHYALAMMSLYRLGQFRGRATARNLQHRLGAPR